MSDSQWRRLAPSCQIAFRIAAGAVAAAGRNGLQEWNVDSGALLVGIMNAHQGTRQSDPVDELLEFAGRTREELLSALEKAAVDEDPFERVAASPLTLDDLPPLGAAAEQALRTAVSFADERRIELVPLSFLFAGLLRVPQAAAVRALEAVVGARLVGGLQQTIGAYLDVGDSVRFLAWLRAQFPQAAAAPAPEPVPRPPRPRPGARATNDRAAERDLLGFGDYVGAFADLIESRDTTTPITIGLFGTWGIGKSFLLAQLEAELRRRAEQHRLARLQNIAAPASTVYSVYFNAWEYSAVEAIWPALARKVLEALELRTSPGRLQRLRGRLRRNARRIARRQPGTLLAGLTILAATIAVAVWQGGWVAAVLAVLTGGGIVKLGADALGSPLGQLSLSLFSDRGYGGAIPYMEDIRADMTRLTRKLEQEESRILVLIDDLDRCEPEQAVQMLQAINLLLNFDDAPFVVVLGVDARVVTRAIEKHYDGVLNVAGASGFEYLEKIVQIPFRIPEPDPTAIARFLKEQLKPEPASTDGAPSAAAGSSAGTAATASGGDGGRAPADAPVVQAEAIEEFTNDELQAFENLVEYLRPNPRHLKRLINVYRLVRAVAERRVETTVTETPARTIRWLALCGQWPYTVRTMLAVLDDLRHTNAVELKSEPDDPLRLLLDLARPQIDSETCARYDDEADRLSQLLDEDGWTFTWKELQTIRGYTINFNPAVDSELTEIALPAAPVSAPTAPTPS